MNYIGRLILILFIAIVAVVLYLWGEFPHKRRETKGLVSQKKVLVILVGGQFLFLSLGIYVLAPLINGWGANYYFVYIVLATLLLVVLPFLHIDRFDRWSLRDIGFNRKILLPKLALFATISYVIYTIIRIFALAPAYFPFWIILLMFYSNAIIEEYFNRGIIQSKLETIYDPKHALLLQTIIFTIIHVPANLANFLENQDIFLLVTQFVFQIIHGFIYGLLYMKTKNIWPSIICHYFTNWLAPIIFLF